MGVNVLKMDAFCLRVSGTAKGGDNNNPPSWTSETVSSMEEATLSAEELSVLVSPNPVVSYFNLAIRSNDNI